MKKNWIAAILAGAIVTAALAGCGKQNTNNTPAQSEEPAAAATTDAAADKAATTDTGVDEADSDSQNPIMNFIGPYTAKEDDDYTMQVDSGPQGQRSGTVWVWKTDDDQRTEWILDVVLNEAGDKMEYTHATKNVYTYNETTQQQDVQLVYEDGTGSLLITNDAAGTVIKWQDDKEDAGKGLSFTFSADNHSDDDDEEEFDEKKDYSDFEDPFEEGKFDIEVED